MIGTVLKMSYADEVIDLQVYQQTPTIYTMNSVKRSEEYADHLSM